jgi:hypothetical protein
LFVAWKRGRDFVRAVYTGRKIPASLSYVILRGEGKMEDARGSKTPYALSFPLPPRTSAGWPPTCVFVTVNEARRYLATSRPILEMGRSPFKVSKPIHK